MVIYLLLCCNVVIFYEAHLLSSSANFLPTTYNFAFSYKTFNELNPAQHSGLEGFENLKIFWFLVSMAVRDPRRDVCIQVFMKQK